MAYEADKVVVELVAEVDKFDSKIKQSAATFDAATAKIEGGVTRMNAAQFKAAGGVGGLAEAFKKAAPAVTGTEHALGRMTLAGNNSRVAMLELGHVARGAGDQFAAGTPLTQIFTQHLGQVAQAASFSGKSLGGVATFLGGPWGIALTLATVVLAKFTFGHKEAADSVDSLVQKLKDHAEKTQNANRAQGIFGGTIEGVTAALDENRKALDQLNDSDTTAARKTLAAAEAQAINTKAIRETTLALLKQAEAQLLVLQGQASGGRGGLRDTGASAEIRFVEGKLTTLRAAIETATKELGRAKGQVEEALAARVVEMTHELADPVKAIESRYKGLIKAAQERAIAEGTVRTTLAAQVAELEKQERAEIKAAQARKNKPQGESGRQVSADEAASIARAAGLLVNSASRSFAQQKALFDKWVAQGRPADNPVAAPGTSAHEGARGRWALDIQLTKGLTPDIIRKAFAAQGVSLSKVFQERGHFHIEGSRSDAAGAELAAEREREKAARALTAEQQRRQGFENELANLTGDEINARQALVTSAEAIAELEKQAIEVSRAKYDDNLKSLVETKRLTATEAAELAAINNERAKLRAELVDRREAERKFRMQEQAFQNAQDFQAATRQDETAILQGQRELATTAKQRAAIERRLLDLQFQEEKAHLQSVINLAERLKIEKGINDSATIQAMADASRAKIALESLPQRQANATASSDRSTASPLQSYFTDLQAQAGDLDSAFERIAAGGLATFTDALTNAIVNFTSLGDVGRAVLQAITADLVRLAIQQVIMRTIGASLGSAAVATTAAEAAAAGAAWAGPAALASLATLGANAGPAAAALASTTALATLIGTPRAAGGRIFGPGGPTSDRVPIMASADEYMIRASSARKIGYSALDHLNRHGEMPFAAGGRIRSVSPLNVAAANPRSGGNGFSQSDIATLRSIVSEAARAQPDVNLYASLDPADMLQRALGTPAGHRALLAHLGNNSGAVKATLNR